MIWMSENLALAEANNALFSAGRLTKIVGHNHDGSRQVNECKIKLELGENRQLST